MNWPQSRACETRWIDQEVRACKPRPEFLSGARRNSFQVEDYCAFRDGWTGGAKISRVLTDPIPRHSNALVGAGLILVDGHRKSATSGADQEIPLPPEISLY